VSGDLVVLDGPVAGGWAARFIETLKSIVDQIGPEGFALIGGLAVMTRLGGAYRATDDIDTATVRIPVDFVHPFRSISYSGSGGFRTPRTEVARVRV
jgi:hypothetical protein